MFRHTHLLILGLCLLLSSLILAQQPARTDTQSAAGGLAGKWEIPKPGNTWVLVSLTSIDVKGDTFTGSIAQWPIVDGKINGNEITFKLMAGGQVISLLTGKFYGDQISMLIENAPGRPSKSGKANLGVKHPWTAFRNRTDKPLRWIPEEVSPLPFATPVSVKDATPASVLTGRFEAPFVWGTKTYTYDFVFEASGNKLTGKAALLGSTETFDISDGKINGNDVSFSWLQAGKAVARFTGTLYENDLALVMEEIGPKRMPEATGGMIHPMTAVRYDGDKPWYTRKWLPSWTAAPGQVPDPNFDVKISHPAYTAQHPKVVIDEAHKNFHTADNRYKPFADLMRNDGYEIARGTQPFTAEGLQGAKVLVVANAMAAKAGEAAFTDAECAAVRDWVRSGGALLLIADHTPFGAAAEPLGLAFGVQMGKGFAFVLGEGYSAANPTFFVFSHENGLLQDHPITRGREASERVQKVVTFTGQALSVPQGASVILKLAPTAMESPSQPELQAAMKDLKSEEKGIPKVLPVSGKTEHAKPTSGAQGLALPFGKGRVVILGEAAMMTAQLTGDTKMGMNVPGNDDRQFALNIMRWLSGTLN